MREDIKKFCEIKKVSDDLVMIFSQSYLNPIDYLPIIEEELCRNNFRGDIIFDLLLSNGNSFNRFIWTTVADCKINKITMKVLKQIDKNILKKAHNYYISHEDLLENSILSDIEKRELLKS